VLLSVGHVRRCRIIKIALTETTTVTARRSEPRTRRLAMTRLALESPRMKSRRQKRPRGEKVLRRERKRERASFRHATPRCVTAVLPRGNRMRVRRRDISQQRITPPVLRSTQRPATAALSSPPLFLHGVASCSRIAFSSALRNSACEFTVLQDDQG